jgi:hypothetical protein
LRASADIPLLCVGLDAAFFLGPPLDPVGAHPLANGLTLGSGHLAALLGCGRTCAALAAVAKLGEQAEELFALCGDGGELGFGTEAGVFLQLLFGHQILLAGLQQPVETNRVICAETS